VVRNKDGVGVVREGHGRQWKRDLEIWNHKNIIL